MTDENKKARVAIVGCGGWSQGWHLPNLAARNIDAEIVALCDREDTPGVGGCVPSLCVSMNELCEKYNAKRYKSVEELLADDDELKLDGVLVAVPHAHHSSVGGAVLKAGKHLLMEKPMSADVDDARNLYELGTARPNQAFLLNNTANWQPGLIAAYEAVKSGKIGQLKHISCVFAAPLGWLFEGEDHGSWNKKHGTMVGNGFAWGQFSHTFAWIFKVTGLTPRRVYCASIPSEKTGADLYDAVVVTCTNGCTINASGVGSCPDKGFKIIGNWLFGTKGMMSYNGLAGSDNVKIDEAGGSKGADGAAASRLEIWTNDGSHEVGPPVQFEHLDQEGTGPGSLDAFVQACRDEEYFVGAGAVEGLKSVCTIDAMYRSAQSGKAEDVRGCDDL